MRRAIWVALFTILIASQVWGQAPVNDDSYVTSQNPNAKNGGATSLIVQASNNSRTFIRFNLDRFPTGNAANPVTSAMVMRATIRLFPTAVTTTGTFDVYAVVGSASNWDEATITYNTQPLSWQLIKSAVPVGPVKDYIVIDVTQTVKDWIDYLNGTGGLYNNGFVLVPSTGSSISVTFNSKVTTNYGHDPELSVVWRGPDGIAGPTGAPGATGPSGPEGPLGATGTQGPQGPAGTTGPAGSTGPAGPIGATGTQGVQGPAGTTGPAGSTGPAGPVGATGTQGVQGPAGTTGPAGSTGPAGPVGATGAQGTQGLTGPAGSTGPAGPVGATGAQGLQGLTGPAGSTGPAGPVGATGTQGPQGLTGSTGPQGPAGTTGATGPQGVAGPTGPSGPIGLMGPAGPAGPTGPSGITVRTCIISIGANASGSTLSTSDSDLAECVNSTGTDLTITKVSCMADAGSPTVLPILTGGASSSILTSALTCGNGAFAAGVLNGAPVIHSTAANGACSTSGCSIDGNIAGVPSSTRMIRIVVTAQ